MKNCVASQAGRRQTGPMEAAKVQTALEAERGRSEGIVRPTLCTKRSKINDSRFKKKIRIRPLLRLAHGPLQVAWRCGNTAKTRAMRLQQMISPEEGFYVDERPGA
jgi:hypothetical protein